MTVYGLKSINLHTADLGRHIKNGEIVFEDANILKTNFYSYTNEHFPFINHHWMIGIIFAFIYKLGGFQLLSVFYALIKGIAVALVVWSTEASNKIKTGILSLIPIIPLLSYRQEIRPEGISFLFLAIYIVLIILYKQKKMKIWHAMILLLPLQVIWANTHIFFIFGPYLMGLLSLENWMKKKKKEGLKIGICAIALYLTAIINPNHIYGLMEPFNIFREYKYMLVENKDIFFIIKRLGGFIHIYTLFVALALLISTFNKIKQNKDLIIEKFFELAIFITFIGAALAMVRFISIFALVSIPLVNILLSKKLSKWSKEIRIIAFSGAFLFILIPNTPFSIFSKGFGIGLASNSLSAANFFKQNKLEGPIFNNYDNGGYLIFNLFPQEKVFIDNRPEAYSSNFIQNTYIKMQESEEVWSTNSEMYGINTIFFYRHDLTTWAQPFLIRRIQDDNWVPVYVDEYTLILVANNEKNKHIIQKHMLPQEMFTVTSN